ncbi:MAG: hypothetical protein AAF480_10570 [Actinomycetota bacterium]
MGSHPSSGFGVFGAMTGVAIASYVSISVTVAFALICILVVTAAAVRRHRDRSIISSR